MFRGDGSLWYPAQKTLLVADLHLGKDVAFRQWSVPIPLGSNQETLRRLGRAVAETASERVIVLGDLWHARESVREGVAEEWRTFTRGFFACQFGLVTGNHDRKLAAAELANLVECIPDGHQLGPFCVAHDPADMAGAGFAGHLHPGIVLQSRGSGGRKLRCFWRRGDTLILPAFGELTGAVSVRPTEDDYVWALTGSESRPILPVDPVAWLRTRVPAWL